MNSGSFSRRARRGNVDPTTGKKRAYYNCRKNSTGGRRYSIQGILSKRAKDCNKPTFKKGLEESAILKLLSEWRSNIRRWRQNANIIKFIRHDQYA